MANITNIVDSVIAKVNTHTTDIATKANTTYVDSGLDAKADTTYVDTEVSGCRKLSAEITSTSAPSGGNDDDIWYQY